MAIVRENEEKKRYLNGYRDCTRRERQLQEQIEELRSQQMFPSVNHDGMPQGNAHSDLSGYVARLDALISQLEHEQAMAVRQYKEIHDRIHKMQDGSADSAVSDGKDMGADCGGDGLQLPLGIKTSREGFKKF